MVDFTRYLQWFGGCRVKDKVYFIDMTFNGVFCLNVEDYSVQFVHTFSCLKADCVSASFCSAAYNDMVYFFPTNANVVMRYDIHLNQEKVIPICDCTYFLTAAAIQCQSLVYLFPFDLSLGIYVLNLESNIIVKDDELSGLFKESSYCANALLVQNSHILVGLYEKNILVEIDMETKKIVREKYLNRDLEIYTICLERNNCWILLINSTDIFEWNMTDDVISVYTNVEPVWRTKNNRMPYSNLIFLDEDVLVLNAMLRNIFHMNKEKHRIENPIILSDEFKRIDYGNNFYSMFGTYTILEDKVLIHPCWGNRLIVYDRLTKQIEEKRVGISGRGVPNLEELFFKRYKKEGIYTEMRDVMTVECLIVMLDKGERKWRAMKNQKIGEAIYRYTAM